MKKLIDIKLVMCAMVALLAVSSCKEKESTDFVTAPHLTSGAFDVGIKEEGAIRLVSYNVWMFQSASSGDIADMMNEIEADAVGMQEVYEDQLAYSFSTPFGADASYFGNAGGKTRDYGNAISSKGLTVVDSYSVQMEVETDNEQRGFLVVEYDKFVFVATHLDLVESARLEEIEILTENLKSNYGSSAKPVILCGDMNAKLGSDTMNALLENFTVISSTVLSTYPASSPSSCIDFILQLNNGAKCTVTYTDVLRSFSSGDVRETSDHLPVAVDIVI